MMKRKFATKTKKTKQKTNTAPREQYTRHGISQTRKKKIAHQISSQQASLLQNKTARRLSTRLKIVFKNGLKTKTDRKSEKTHSTSVYRKLLKLDHKNSKSKRNQRQSTTMSSALALSLSLLSHLLVRLQSVRLVQRNQVGSQRPPRRQFH
jgi:hypothetical protein